MGAVLADELDIELLVEVSKRDTALLLLVAREEAAVLLAQVGVAGGVVSAGAQGGNDHGDAGDRGEDFIDQGLEADACLGGVYVLGAVVGAGVE